MKKINLKSLNNPTVINIARICHEAIRAYCISIGDDSLVAWAYLPAAERAFVVAKVIAYAEDPAMPDEFFHEQWRVSDRAKDIAHLRSKELGQDVQLPPAYALLPESEKYKYVLFRSIVKTVLPDEDHFLFSPVNVEIGGKVFPGMGKFQITGNVNVEDSIPYERPEELDAESLITPGDNLIPGIFAELKTCTPPPTCALHLHFDREHTAGEMRDVAQGVARMMMGKDSMETYKANLQNAMDNRTSLGAHSSENWKTGITPGSIVINATGKDALQVAEEIAGYLRDIPDYKNAG